MKARLSWQGWLVLALSCGLAIPLLLALKPRSPLRFPLTKTGVFHRSKNFKR